MNRHSISTGFGTLPADHVGTRYVTSSGTVLEFWEHDYETGSFITQGHCFPGGQTGFGQYGCAETPAFVYGELAMAFFIDHPSP